MIDRYVTELDRALRGPRAAKADLLAEARDGLVDTAAAYEEAGLDRQSAERRAVADFGPVPVVAPDFQAVLGLAQQRRTAVLVCAVLLPQPVVWELLASLTGRSTHPIDPTYQLVDTATCWAGRVAVGLALLLVVVSGTGVRYLGVRRVATRLTGVFAFAVCGVFALLGVLHTAVAPGTPLRDPTGLPAVAVVLGLPLAGVAVSGLRCLTAA